MSGYALHRSTDGLTIRKQLPRTPRVNRSDCDLCGPKTPPRTIYLATTDSSRKMVKLCRPHLEAMHHVATTTLAGVR